MTPRAKTEILFWLILKLTWVVLTLIYQKKKKKKERFGRSVQPHRLYILQKSLNKKGKAFYTDTTSEANNNHANFNNRKQRKQMNEINITYVLLN